MEHASLSRLPLHLHRAAVEIHDLPGDGAPQANPLRLGAKEGIEDPL